MNINPTSKRTIFLTRCYYFLKPLIPRSVQLTMRRRIALWKKAHFRHSWPIDQTAGQAPEGWSGWPEKKKFAFALMHDVDTQYGLSKCLDLAHLEMEVGFRSSFNFVPERYKNSNGFIEDLREKALKSASTALSMTGNSFRLKPFSTKDQKK